MIHRVNLTVVIQICTKKEKRVVLMSCELPNIATPGDNFFGILRVTSV